MKYSVADVRKEYARLDALCGVDTTGIKIKVSTKGVNQHGSCRSRKVGTKMVPISITLGNHIFESDKMFWNVIRHEYAHALVTIRDGKRHGHDSVWKAACTEIGCNPSRTTTYEPNEALEAKREARAKYILFCPHCGNQYRYYRRSKVVMSAQRGVIYICSKCHLPLDFKEL